MLKDDEDLLVGQIGLDDPQPLFDRCVMLEAAPGEVLMHDHQPVDSLYLLLAGRLAMAVEVAGHSIQLGEIDPGNWVGEVALFSGSQTAVSTVSVVAESRLLRLPFTAFAELAKEAPEIACRLTHVLSGMLIQRLRATINDPILDPEGQLLMLGNLSLPLPAPREQHGVRDFFKKLLGVD